MRRRRKITGKIPLTELGKEIKDKEKRYKKFTNEELIFYTLAQLVNAADIHRIDFATSRALTGELYTRKSNEQN